MKKVFAIVLIVCLAMTAVFADKGDFKVGAQLGMGTVSEKGKEKLLTVDTTTVSSNGGFYFALAGEFEFADNIALKAEVGMNLLGKATVKVTAEGHTESATASDKSPALFAMYFGGEYIIEVNKSINVAIGAGFDMLSGKMDSSDDAESNAKIGLGIESVMGFKLEDNFSLDLGVKFSLFFANSNKDYADSVKNLDSYSSTGFKFFAGATYSL